VSTINRPITGIVIGGRRHRRQAWGVRHGFAERP